MATANLGRVGFVNKGTYSSATAYKVNDVVVYNSGTYACIQANTGQAPTNTSYWQNWVADNAVHKTGDETIAGVKTFSNNVVMNGNVGIGTTTPARKLEVQSYGVGAAGILRISGLAGSASTTNVSLLELSITGAGGGTITQNLTARYNNGYEIATYFADRVSWRDNATNTQLFAIDSSGNALVTNSGGGLGYGTGSGGTVTQLTSKSTAVTLNKPSGYITMNNAALAAGASVAFIFNNSIISYSDQILITRATTGTTAGYNLWIDSVGAGACTIVVKNITGVSLSEAIVLSYSIIKGAAS